MNDKEVSSNFKSLIQFLGHVVHVCPELTEVAEEKKAWLERWLGEDNRQLMMESMAINHFRHKISNIQNSNLRDFVCYCFGRFAPDDFYTASASSTGKHHPECSLGEGGLVRHVRLACWWAECFIDCFALESSDADCVRVAILLHDLYKTKEFPSLTHEEVMTRHGAILAHDIMSDQLSGFTFGPQRIESECLDKITSAIAGHMGRWTTPASAIPRPQPFDLVPLVVHLADYVASRRVDLDIA